MTETRVPQREAAQKNADGTAVLSFLVTSSASTTLPLYWIKFDPAIVKEDRLLASLEEVLVDPVYQKGVALSQANRKELFQRWRTAGFEFFAEKQFLPGVTDNLAHTICEALGLKGIKAGVAVASGQAYLLKRSDSLCCGAGSGGTGDSESGSTEGETASSGSATGGGERATAGSSSAASGSECPSSTIESNAQYKLYHPLVETFHVHELGGNDENTRLLSFPDVRLPAAHKPETINLDISDEELLELSRTRLLALTLDEMKVIAAFYEKGTDKSSRTVAGLPKQPTDVELEIIAQTWSEHCKHKIFNAFIAYTEIAEAPDADKAVGTSSLKPKPKTVTISSLYKTYIKLTTRQLADRRPDLLSVFEDNSGVVKWNDDWAVCFKVETHNSPSALEPYGGALTGILGVNRDILGTGLGARPIFNTDVFCFAHPSSELAMRPKMLPPDTIPKGVRKGVEDGGNKSGIPTVNGAIFFHDNYRAKPLVFCGTGGILPIERNGIKMYEKHTKKGDRIIMVGGRVGADGIHGATFSSESLHEGSPVTAVQIGDPFTQKRVIDFVLAARDQGLITGITDNGAGGLSSSVGEMATFTGGATIELSKVPLKYPGLEDWQIVVSESQERMTISTDRPAELVALGMDYGVECSDIGEFHDRGCFEVLRDGKPVALLDLDFLHNGLPQMTLKAHWEAPTSGVDLQRVLLNEKTGKTREELEHSLLELLAHPNIASRQSVIRQYDHEVQGASVIKPLMGKRQTAPCDAAVIKPLLDDDAGLVVSNGICPQLSELDTYLMAASAVDEAIRNAVCVGADPTTVSLLDNFCWPDPVASARNKDGEYKLGQLVRTCQGLQDACLAFGAPLISGKDSMKNDFDDGALRLSIPPTLLVSAIAKIHDAATAVSMDFKAEGDHIYLLTTGRSSLKGSHYAEVRGVTSKSLPALDFSAAPLLYKLLHQLIGGGHIRSAHDLSEGGLAVALSECIIGSGLGAQIDLEQLVHDTADDTDVEEHPAFNLFAEGPGRIVVTVPAGSTEELEAPFRNSAIRCIPIGKVTADAELVVKGVSGKPLLELDLEKLERAWNAELPFD